MPIFRYEAVDKTGKTVRGAMDGPSEQFVAQKLANMGYRAQTILRPGMSASQAQAAPVQQSVASVDRPQRSVSGNPVSVETCVSLRELAFFYRRLAAYIKSGLSPYDALSDLQSSTRNRKLKTVTVRMADRVKSGERLSAAMAEFPHVFPVHATAQIWNGELGGYVDRAIDEVAQSMEEEVKDNRYARIGWIIFKITMVSFILTIPAMDLKSLFLSGVNAIDPKVGSKLPDIDNIDAAGKGVSTGLGGSADPWQIALAVLKGYLSTVVHSYLPIIIGLLVFWWLYARLKRTPAIKRVLDSIILAIPLWGNLQRERARSRFARSFAALSRSGIAPATAWDAASLTVRNSVIADQLRACTPMLRQNSTLQDVFVRCGIYTHEAAGMVATGERTGQIADMVERLADYHEGNTAGLKSHARMFAIHGLILLSIIMTGYVAIQAVRAVVELETKIMPQMLGIPGL